MAPDLRHLACFDRTIGEGIDNSIDEWKAQIFNEVPTLQNKEGTTSACSLAHLARPHSTRRMVQNGVWLRETILGVSV